jgi:hypothetical protein
MKFSVGNLVKPKRNKEIPVELHPTDSFHGSVTMELDQVGLVIPSNLQRYGIWVRIFVNGRTGDGYPDDFELV